MVGSAGFVRYSLTASYSENVPCHLRLIPINSLYGRPYYPTDFSLSVIPVDVGGIRLSTFRNSTFSVDDHFTGLNVRVDNFFLNNTSGGRTRSVQKYVPQCPSLNPRKVNTPQKEEVAIISIR